MNIAFYAPLKPPTHPTPSGDREIARNFMAALALAGHHVELASRFRSREGAGDRERQRRLQAVGERLATRLIGRYQKAPRAERPDVWFTYHLYHKAPDFLGPAVAAALDIPYVVAEASYAPKQSNGAWSQWNEISASAIVAATLILAINSDDLPCLEALVGRRARIERLPPSIDIAPFKTAMRARREASSVAGEGRTPRSALPVTTLPVPTLPVPSDERSEVRSRHDADKPLQILVVAMMRGGRKLESYQLLATSLARLLDLPWQVVVVGDGQARQDVETAFAALPAGRVVFRGRIEPADLPEVYLACDIFAWPAVGEPLGMVFLEAQAAGLPVVACRGRGVGDLVVHERTGLLVEDPEAKGIAAGIRALIVDRVKRERMSRAAEAHIDASHTLDASAVRLDGLFRSLVGSS